MSKKCKKAQEAKKDNFDDNYQLPKHLDTQGCMNLVAGIVKQARQDVVKAKPGSYVRMDAERFFQSEYFTALTGVDGNQILDQLWTLADKRRAKQMKEKRHENIY